jgi:hypothetical protein
MAQAGTRFAAAHLMAASDASVRQAVGAGSIVPTANDALYPSRHVSIGGREFLDFAAYSHLGLEQRVIEPVRHGRPDELESKVQRLSKKHWRTWYLADGPYSILGDLAPVDGIGEPLDQYPQQHAYIDDAHSTSCAGVHRRGHSLEGRQGYDPTVLWPNTAFLAGGAALFLQNGQPGRQVVTYPRVGDGRRALRGPPRLRMAPRLTTRPTQLRRREPRTPCRGCL